MKRRGSGESTLDKEFAWPQDTITRDGAIFEALRSGSPKAKVERERMLDDQIAMGWGDVPQGKIPKNWRSRYGPDKTATADRKKAVSRARRKSLAGGQREKDGKFTKHIADNNLRHDTSVSDLIDL